MTEATDNAYLDADAKLRSARFDDIYFSLEDGLAETRHTFIAGNGLPERWHSHDGLTFIIGELGFGSGLNFLATWQAFEQAAPGCRLHFVSIEGYPLTRDLMAETTRHWPELAPYREALLAHWPERPVARQVWQQCFGQVTLSVVFGEVLEALDGCHAYMHSGMDAWYLDGFAPGKNPAMWRPEVLRRVADLSRPGASFATFTAAGAVKRGMRDVGFSVHKKDGFGRKRDMLCGRMMADERSPVGKSPKRVGVIGAGLAGTATALSLSRRGFEVHLLDRHDGPAAEASGNHLGVLYPHLTKDRDGRTRWSLAAFDHAMARLAELRGLETSGKGVLMTAHNEDRLHRFADIAAIAEVAERGIKLVDTETASELAGVPVEHPCLWMPDGVSVPPTRWCEAHVTAAENLGLQCHWQTTITELRRRGDGWRVVAGKTSVDFDALVLCTGAALPLFADADILGLRPVRGAVSLLRASDSAPNLKATLCHKGYNTPAMQGLHAVGATFDPHDDNETLTEADHAHNLGLIEKHAASAGNALWPQGAAAAVVNGRVAFRMTTPDRYPVIGPWESGLWLNLGHGSRGLTTTPIAGEIIAGAMAGELIALPKSLLEAVKPQRFAERAAKATRRRGR